MKESLINPVKNLIKSSLRETPRGILREICDQGAKGISGGIPGRFLGSNAEGIFEGNPGEVPEATPKEISEKPLGIFHDIQNITLLNTREFLLRFLSI